MKTNCGADLGFRKCCSKFPKGMISFRSDWPSFCRTHFGGRPAVGESSGAWSTGEAAGRTQAARGWWFWLRDHKKKEES